MKKEITIKAIEFWALIVMMITLSITLAVNTIQTNKLIESYDAKIEIYETSVKAYQNKIDEYEEEIYKLRENERNDKFIIDASLINTEMLNNKLEETNLLTSD